MHSFAKANKKLNFKRAEFVQAKLEVKKFHEIK